MSLVLNKRISVVNDSNKIDNENKIPTKKKSKTRERPMTTASTGCPNALVTQALKTKTPSPALPVLRCSVDYSVALQRLRRAKEIGILASEQGSVCLLSGNGYYFAREAIRRRGWVEKVEDTKKQIDACMSVESFYASDLTPQTSRSPLNLRFRSGIAHLATSQPSSDAIPTTSYRQRRLDAICHIYGAEMAEMPLLMRDAIPRFCWTSVGDEWARNLTISRSDVVWNHFLSRGGSFVTKEGLCDLVNDEGKVKALGIEKHDIVPRTYRLNRPEEMADFVIDFKLSACVNLLKYLVGNCRLKEEEDEEEEDEEEEEKKGGGGGGGGGGRLKNEKEKMEDKLLHVEQATTTTTTTTTIPNSFPARISELIIQTAMKQLKTVLVHHNHVMRNGTAALTDVTGVIADQAWPRLLANIKEITAGNRILDLSRDILFRCRSMLGEILPITKQHHIDGDKNIWILKPPNASRGRGIVISQDLEEILSIASSRSVICQKYIERPLTIHDTKFDIRQWFMITSWNPLELWWYKDSYIRFSSQIFDLQNFDRSIHLTNNAVQSKCQNDSQRSSLLPEDNMWNSKTFADFCKVQTKDVDVFGTVTVPKMRRQIAGVMRSASNVMIHRQNSFEIFGADFMVDTKFNPWLLEINASPALGASTSITKQLCRSMVEDALKVALDRRKDPDVETGGFELVSLDPVNRDVLSSSGSKYPLNSNS